MIRLRDSEVWEIDNKGEGTLSLKKKERKKVKEIQKAEIVQEKREQERETDLTLQPSGNK